MSKQLFIWGLVFCASMGFAQLAASQTVVDSLPAPGSQTRGLAWDGTHLWNADANDTVYQIDPSTGAVVSSFYFVIDAAYGGITWSQDDNLWIANGNYIYKVNPTTGDIVYDFHCPGG
jgi:DNA-binding beta-propeller fold protein YncE